MKNNEKNTLLDDSKKTEASDNNVFTHRRTSRLGPGREVEEVDAGTHPHHLTASRPVTT